MKILLIYNGFLFENLPYFAKRFEQSCAALGILFCAKKNTDFLVTNGEIEKLDFDAVLFFDKDLTLARAMERQGLMLINSATTLAVCDDKQMQAEKLAGLVPVIKTIASPKCFFANDGKSFLENICKVFQFPIVIKEKNGSQGKQVYLAGNLTELQNIYSEKSGKELIFQQFISESCGRDIRIFIAFGKVLGAIERRAKAGEFRSNIELGGTSTPYNLNEDQKNLALLCAAILKLDICGVDLLFLKKGNVVCEVNANPGFENLEKTLGIDVAGEIITMLKFKIEKISGK